MKKENFSVLALLIVVLMIACTACSPAPTQGNPAPAPVTEEPPVQTDDAPGEMTDEEYGQPEQESRAETDNLQELAMSMEAYLAVLKNEAPVFSADLKSEMTLEELCVQGTEKTHFELEVMCFAVVNMDRLGPPEIVLDASDIIILHYEAGTVYAYTFGVRSMQMLTKDGVYHGANGAASGVYARIEGFDGAAFDEVTLGEYDGDSYLIDGESVAEAEFNAQLNYAINGEKAEWFDFTAAEIEARLKQ